jgi:hypothetical protein
MGTSNSGAGGGSGGSGGGGGDGGAGTVTLVKGGLQEVDPKEEKAWAALQSVYSRLSRDYLNFVAADAGVGAAYEALHRLHVMLVQEHSWENVEKRFGVAGESGCLKKLADALSPEDGPGAVHPRLRASLQTALLDFFSRIVGDNVLVRNTGDAAAVLAHLTPEAFQSTSALFLGKYLAETLRHEEPTLSRLARSRLAQFSEAKANQVVAAFKARFRGKPWHDLQQVSYTHLFRVMQGEPEWLAEQLRRDVKNQGPVSSAA